MVDEIAILHVDDEPSMRDLTKAFLEREDEQFTVETVASADKGLERLDDGQPDCIVSDYNMPGMDGLEFLGTVREAHPELPFILFTGRGSEEVASDAIAAGVTDYLQKGPGAEQYELLANRVHNAVSARREAKRAEKQERFTTQALDALEDLFYVLNEDSSLRRWNEQFAETTGYPESELAGMQATELFPEDDREAIADAIETTLTTGEVTVEADLLTADGERLPYEFTGARLTDGDGSATGLVGVGRNLTDHREQEQRFQALVEESRDNISVVDADGVIQYQSPAVERIFGHEPTERTGDTAWEYVHPDDRERLKSTFEEWVATPGATGPVEYRARHADGSWRWMEANGNNQLDNPDIEGYVINSRDITDRKERRQELERSRDLMRNMEQLADVGVWEYDAEQENLRMTEGVRRFYQLDDDEEFTLEQALDAVHPDDREALADRIYGCLETGQSYEIEVRLLPPDGEQEWVTVRGGPVTGGDSDGVVRGYVQDITDRKECERELRQTQDLMAKMEQLAEIGAWEYDPEEDKATHTAGERRIYGLNPESDLPLDEAFEFYHPEDRGQLRVRFEECLETGEPYSMDVRVTRADGEQRWVTAQGQRIQQQDSEVVRGYVQDITDQKEQINTLKQTETLFENAQDMLFIIEHSDNEFIIKRVNQAFESATGLSNDDIQGKTPQELFGEARGREIEERYHKCIKKGESLSYEETLTEEQIPSRDSPTDDGLVYWNTHIAPVRVDGDVDWIVGSTRDINEQKRREQRLKRRNERLDEFTSIVSHDLRNPLGVAEGRLELARDDCNSEHLDDAADAVGRCQALISDLLTLAREGEWIGEIGSVGLANIAEQSWQTVASESAELNTEAKRRIRANGNSLQQLFENLYRNAVEHGGDNVTVQVSAMDGGFYVADTGPGIPESEREAVFEAGYSTSERGTGFGLRIVKQIVDGHGWNVAVTESEQGGARFEITGVDAAE